MFATGFMKQEGETAKPKPAPLGRKPISSLPCIFPSFSQVDWEREIGALAQTSDKQVPLGIKRGDGTSDHFIMMMTARQKHNEDCGVVMLFR